MKQLDINRAGDLYEIVQYRLLPKLTQDAETFREVADQLLFLDEKPYVQIEIATEAIGMNYRMDEAIVILERIATWEPNMNLQTEEGKV